MTKTEATHPAKTTFDADVCIGRRIDTVQRRPLISRLLHAPVRPPPPTHHSGAITAAYQTGCRSNALTSATGLTTNNGANGTTPYITATRVSSIRLQ
jgi:hypothetical protein